MQVDERRACPSCSADNPHDAEFCWQCYARFTPVPVPPAPSTMGVAAPQPQSRGGTIAKVAAGVVLALVVGAVVRNLFAPHYHVPQAMGGQPRIHDADTDRFEQDMIADGDKEGVTIEAAAYGTNGTPDVLLILVNGKAAENTDALFDSFLEGIASSGVTVERSQTSTGPTAGPIGAACRFPRAGSTRSPACGGRTQASG
ncbi:MAG: hypothetical protein ABJB55_05245 [Actinomycetota bacterium]